MAPRYVLCPCCEFPTVVRGCELDFPRHCRQCKKAYTPGDVAESSNVVRQSDSPTTRPSKRRRALIFRALFRPRPRGAL